MTKNIAINLLLLLLLISLTAYSELSKEREKALDILWAAYTQLQQGDPTAIDGVERALKIDPNFAYANIVRAEFAMANQDWESARTYYLKGLKHLHEPDQPLSPVTSVKITAKEVEADSRIFLGYTYIKLAQRANAQGQTQLERKYLDSAKINLKKGNNLSPGPKARAMAERLLRMFQY